MHFDNVFSRYVSGEFHISQPGISHEIPVERLKKESLNQLSSIPAYMTRKEESRKVSRDCYVYVIEICECSTIEEIVPEVFYGVLNLPLCFGPVWVT